jgi:hypothetical protein
MLVQDGCGMKLIFIFAGRAQQPTQASGRALSADVRALDTPIKYLEFIENISIKLPNIIFCSKKI